MAEGRVGLMVGREWSFPPKFIEEVNRRGAGVSVDYVRLGGTSMDERVEYDVVIDRISHEVPYYRSWLKHAVLEGVTVVNNPFMWTADDKFFGASLATKLGVAHPKTIALPNREYVPGIKHDESLRNLRYPLEWDAILDHIGLPCILKDAHGGGWRDVHVCRTREELMDAYNSSGQLQMVLQEFIQWDQFVRCICIGREQIMPIRYDPRERRYHLDHAYMNSKLGQRVVDDALKLVRALGYDMNSIEFAVRDGVPYAIDFMNPAPDMDINSLGDHYFEWVVNAMADMAIRLAQEPRPQLSELHWPALFGASGAAGSEAAAQRPGARAPGTTGGSGTGGSVLGEVADIQRGNL